jgi:hypothetical protein
MCSYLLYVYFLGLNIFLALFTYDEKIIEAYDIALLSVCLSTPLFFQIFTFVRLTT